MQQLPAFPQPAALVEQRDPRKVLKGRVVTGVGPDVIVPVGQAELLAAALKEKGVEHEFNVCTNMGHGFGQLQYRASIAFFEKRLKPAAKTVPVAR